MSYEDRSAIVEMDEAMSIHDPLDAAYVFDKPPPGEEGFDISHAGREHKIFQGLVQEIEGVAGRQVLQIRIVAYSNISITVFALMAVIGGIAYSVAQKNGPCK